VRFPITVPLPPNLIVLSVLSELYPRVSTTPFASFRGCYWPIYRHRHRPGCPSRWCCACERSAKYIELYESQRIHTVSIDEQTGIQALDRIAADLLPQSNQIARREYEYIRHRTLALFGKRHIATEQILKPMLRETRTEEDFLENIDSLICVDPKAQWQFVTDNLITHASESLVHYIAEHCGLDIELGLRGYLIRFVYTPKHGIWLDQIKTSFGVLRRKLTRFGSFCSLNDLEERIIRLIDYHSVTTAKPYRWRCDCSLLCK
jgi:hypothetical protein